MHKWGAKDNRFLAKMNCSWSRWRGPWFESLAKIVDNKLMLAIKSEMPAQALKWPDEYIFLSYDICPHISLMNADWDRINHEGHEHELPGVVGCQRQHRYDQSCITCNKIGNVGIATRSTQKAVKNFMESGKGEGGSVS